MTWGRYVLGARDAAAAADLYPAARHLALVVATFADGAGASHVSAETLADLSGLHPVSVRRSIGQITRAGLWIRHRGRFEFCSPGLQVCNPARASGYKPSISRNSRNARDAAAAAGDNTLTARMPPAWRRLADPRDIEAIEQLELEV